MTRPRSELMPRRAACLALACCLALTPGLAAAHGHHGWSHQGGFRSGLRSSRPVPFFWPNFGVQVVAPRVYSRFSYRSSRAVIRLGAPGWRSGAWYYGWREGQAGWWWGVDDVWYSYAAPTWPCPLEAPLVAQPIEEAPVNYYCQSAQQYYPWLTQCPEEWRVVPAQPTAPPQ